ncbi:hypothetical protein [Planomonospora algeriensis]
MIVPAGPEPIGRHRLNLPAHVAVSHPTLTTAWADSAYRTKLIDHAATSGIDLHTIRRHPPPCQTSGRWSCG